MHERRSVRLNSRAASIIGVSDAWPHALPQRTRDRCGTVIFPEPLNQATKEEEATLKDVPTPEALSKWLLERGELSTEDWGKAPGSKSVAKCWKEIQEGESGLELWKGPDGKMMPVRVTHVLRAKVCSPQSYDRGMFLFNTWQQMSDGQYRLRNGLLSEKLAMSEVPLKDHLREVCQRAVCQEEMQCVVDGAFRLGPGVHAPKHDPMYRCPIKVETEHFVDYTTEVETSKSYPGLLTLYHLYTVEIICSGLPGFDFNTLEYDHPDKEGERKLKYVHAWVWLEWSQIRRYLFEGSTLKERKTKGSFPDERALARWLGQFDLDLNSWGQENRRSVQDLLMELEGEETQLELWNREDGVPLLMRVVHVLQLKVKSSDKSMFGKFLFQSYTQGKDGKVKPVNRLMARKLSSAQMPFDEQCFVGAAKEIVKRQLTYLMDAHFHVDPNQPLEASQFAESGVTVVNAEFKSHHFDVEDSPSFKGIHTMYHLYGMEVECDKLPLSNFTSLDMGSHRKGANVSGWKWVCWPETLDLLHHRIKGLERQCQTAKQVLADQRGRIQTTNDTLERLDEHVQALQDENEQLLGEEAVASLEEVQSLAQDLRDEMQDLQEMAEVNPCADPESVANMLPPAMVSKMASIRMVSDAFLEEQRRSARKTRRAAGLMTPDDMSPSTPSPCSPPAAAAAAAIAPPPPASAVSSHAPSNDDAVEDTDSMPQRLVQLWPRWWSGMQREGLLILALCATEAAVSMFLSRRQPRSVSSLLLVGGLGLLGVRLL